MTDKNPTPEPTQKEPASAKPAPSGPIRPYEPRPLLYEPDPAVRMDVPPRQPEKPRKPPKTDTDKKTAGC